MGTGQRIVFALLAASVVVIAVLFIGGRARETEGGTGSGSAPTTIETAPGPRTVTSATAPKKKQADAVVVLSAAKPRTVKVVSGETVRFKAKLPAGGTVHVHGYDLEFDAAPGKAVKITFPAKIEGRFEIEDHHTGQQLGTLQVEPN